MDSRKYRAPSPSPPPKKVVMQKQTLTDDLSDVIKKSTNDLYQVMKRGGFDVIDGFDYNKQLYELCPVPMPRCDFCDIYLARYFRRKCNVYFSTWGIGFDGVTLNWCPMCFEKRRTMRS
jgi:hypothetical protein